VTAAPAGRRRPEPPPQAAVSPLRWRQRLRLPEPYDLDWMLGFLADRAAPALERVEPGLLVRVIRLAGAPAVLTVRPSLDPASRWLTAEVTAPAPASNPAAGLVPGDAPAAAHLRRLVRRMLDLDTDLGPFLELARRDPLLGPLVARHPGLRLPQLPDPFEGAVRAIVGQQVSVAAARTVVDRLIRELGEPVAAATGRGLFAFPHPAAMAAASLERLAALGLTRAKAGALIAVAAATAGGAVDWERLRNAAPEAARAALLELPGIGPWTASYIRMRALGDRDAFPASDLGVVKALATLAPRTPVGGIAGLAERWRPFRAYAALHLWRSLAP
jgi:3-methyladenine DNA glycosylase/8-oxoguanine DNA glycosylase